MMAVRSRATTVSTYPTRGQAAFETAFTLPLVLFMTLGFLQLGLALNARLLAQYAIWKAARAGAVEQGNCRVMVHTALAAVLPAITRVDAPGLLGAAFGARRNNRYDPALDGGHSGQIVELVRVRPLPSEIGLGPGDREDLFFDQPAPGDLNTRAEPLRLELRGVFWYRLTIPFANWVISRMLQAHYGISDYTAQNPLLVTQKADWKGTGNTVDRAGEAWPGGRLHDNLGAWGAQRQYLLPIRVTASVRMLSAARVDFFPGGPACPLAGPWPGY